MRREKLFTVSKKDFRVDTFRSGGSGGQNQNTRDTGVRITHLESGAVGESRTHRTQAENKKAAFRRLLDSFKWKQWLANKIAYITNEKDIEAAVDRQMKDIMVEYRKGSEWVEV